MNSNAFKPNHRRLEYILFIALLVLIAIFLDQVRSPHLPGFWWSVTTILAFGPVLILPRHLVIILVLALLVILYGGYRFKWTWTGFGTITYPKSGNTEVRPSKTLWDWMQLLIIPGALGVSVLAFNYWNTNTQNEISADNQREAALQTYFDRMSELLLDKGLRTSKSDAEIRSVARTRTLTVLRMLDGERKGILVQFLYGSQLINNTNTILNLAGANLIDIHQFEATLDDINLSGIDMRLAFLYQVKLKRSNFSNAILLKTRFFEADLSGANFSGADLSLAEFTGSDLSGVDFTGCNLTGVDFTGANLSGANLSDADLTGASVSPQQLSVVKALKGVTMPDGSKHE